MTRYIPFSFPYWVMPTQDSIPPVFTSRDVLSRSDIIAMANAMPILGTRAIFS